MDMSSMDMSPSTTSMAMGATVTATATSAAAATSSEMSMSMSMGGDCKISMLWNWYTIDSCFLSETWHITSHGMFAGSCIGVILLVVSLEFLRRLGKEYDRYLVRNYQSHQAALMQVHSDVEGSPNRKAAGVNTRDVRSAGTFKPNFLQQAVRALLHMLQFAVAYFIMLLAMYYNGYIIICIIIGAYIGAFIFSWETLGGASNGQTSVANEATVCCG